MLVLGPPPPIVFATPTHHHLRKRKKMARRTHLNSVTRCELRRRNDEEDKPSRVNAGQLPWASLAASLFGTGFILGPIIDGIHSGARLVVYQNGAIDIGPLHTNVWVPPLLGLFYLVVGLIQFSLDLAAGPGAPKSAATPEKTASSLIALVLFILVSAELYKAGIPDNVEAYLLFAGAQVIWLLFDNTAAGFLLACIVGIACPLAEIPFIKLFNLWYYPRANAEIFGQGLVTWTITCYFAYTPFLIHLSRYLKSLLAACSDTESLKIGKHLDDELPDPP